MSKTTTKSDSNKLGLGTGLFVGNLSFIMVLAGMAMILIFNSHRAEKKLMSIHKLKSEVQELEYEHSSLKKDLKSSTVLSKLEKSLENKLVFPEQGPILLGPKKI